LQRLDDLQTGLLRCGKQGVRERLITWQNLATRLRQVRPKQLLKQRREVLKVSQKRLNELARAQLRNSKNRFAVIESRLRLLGPEQVLSRGYSITMDAASGKIVRRAKDAKRGQGLKTRVKEGEIRSVVEN
jgi:exodeoxyribonuclease VII large subunit